MTFSVLPVLSDFESDGMTTLPGIV